MATARSAGAGKTHSQDGFFPCPSPLMVAVSWGPQFSLFSLILLHLGIPGSHLPSSGLKLAELPPGLWLPRSEKEKLPIPLKAQARSRHHITLLQVLTGRLLQGQGRLKGRAGSDRWEQSTAQRTRTKQSFIKKLSFHSLKHQSFLGLVMYLPTYFSLMGAEVVTL